MLIRKLFLVVFVVTLVFAGLLRSAMNDFALGNTFSSPWEAWNDRVTVAVRETVGQDRLNEPVEVSLRLPGAKTDGSDIRVVSNTNQELPYQIIENLGESTFRVSFLATLAHLTMKEFHIYYNNPHAISPSYGQVNSILNNQSHSWQTNDVFIKWGEKAGSYSGTTKPPIVGVITTLKFDDLGSGNPIASFDRLTDDWNAWDIDKGYGYLGANVSGDPTGSGSDTGLITANGPIFSELTLGSFRLRSYQGQKNWIVSNGAADSMMLFDRGYNFEKHSGSNERLIHDNGLGDVGPWVGFNDTQANSAYSCFRHSDNGIVFGGIATGTVLSSISAKESGGYNRIISFDDSSNRPDAKIYWYSDTSNGYGGIEKLANQVLNPLQVTVITDSTPPTTTLSAQPAQPDGQNSWYVTKPLLSLSSNESGTTYYRIDNGPQVTYAGSFEVSEGAHNIWYFSVDASNNAESEKTISLNVDLSRPTESTLQDPQNGQTINNVSPSFYWARSDDTVSSLSHYDLYIDGACAIQDISSSVTSVVSPQLAEGSHNWFLRAYDHAGNFTDSATFSFVIDLEAPGVDLVCFPAEPDGNNGWFVTSPSVRFQADETSTVYYRIGSGEYRVFSDAITLPSGEHDIRYYAVDGIGNASEEKSLRFKVDLEKPGIQQGVLPERQVSHYLIGESVTFICDATDSASGIASQLSTINDQPIANHEQRTFNAAGEYSLITRVTDNAGNYAEENTLFTVGHSFKWLYPVRKIGEAEESHYKTYPSSAIPVRFAKYDNSGKFVADRTVRVVISDGVNSAFFSYGKTKNDVQINSCEARYLLSVNSTRFPWMKSGGSYTISAYFGGSYQNLGIKHGEVIMDLK